MIICISVSRHIRGGSGESSSGDLQNDLDLYIDSRAHRTMYSKDGSGEVYDPRKEEFLFLTGQFRLDDP